MHLAGKQTTVAANKQGEGQQVMERMLLQTVNTWQDNTIIYNQACEQKGKKLVDEVSICKLRPAHHSTVKISIHRCGKHLVQLI